MKTRWPNVPEEKRKRIFAYNAAMAKNAEAARDVGELLSRMPPGIAKQLARDPVCAEIITKYGYEVI